MSRSANAEADRHLDAGLTLIPRLADGPDRQSLELALQLARANALTPLKGFNAPETVAALAAANRLLDAGVGTDLEHFSVINGLISANLVAARMEPALALARQLVGIAERQEDAIYRTIGYRTLGMVQNYMGQQRHALQIFNKPSNSAILVATSCSAIGSELILASPSFASKFKQQRSAASPSMRQREPAGRYGLNF